MFFTCSSDVHMWPTDQVVVCGRFRSSGIAVILGLLVLIILTIVIKPRWLGFVVGLIVGLAVATLVVWGGGAYFRLKRKNIDSGVQTLMSERGMTRSDALKMIADSSNTDKMANAFSNGASRVSASTIGANVLSKLLSRK